MHTQAKVQLIAVYSWVTLLLIIIEFFLLAVSLMTYPTVAIYFIVVFGESEIALIKLGTVKQN